MTFRKRLQYLLVKRLNISNKSALILILEGKILINGQSVFENVVLNLEDSVVFEEQVLQEGKKFIYIAFYKPRRIETTLNREIQDNLKDILPFKEELFPVGRLDKESEGLLILTNDGRTFDKILRIIILGKTTLPCFVEKIDDYRFKIILVQGINRQIRRMCYKLDYEVLQLVRVRVGEVCLEDLKPNEFRYFNP
jgi:23S rRNA pseudouridine2604 synthase